MVLPLLCRTQPPGKRRPAERKLRPCRGRFTGLGRPLPGRPRRQSLPPPAVSAGGRVKEKGEKKSGGSQKELSYPQFSVCTRCRCWYFPNSLVPAGPHPLPSILSAAAVSFQFFPQELTLSLLQNVIVLLQLFFRQQYPFFFFLHDM